MSALRAASRPVPEVPPPTASAGSAPLAPGVLHLAALAALGAFGAVRWAELVSPAATGALLAGLLVALAVTTGAAATRRRVGRPAVRALVVAAAVLVLALAGLLAAGVPARLLLPANWGALGAGVVQGAGALPAAAVPYAGADPWARTVILLGGLALLGTGVAAGRADGGDGRRLVATVPLVAAAAIPEVVLVTPAAELRGVALLVLLVAYLRADRLPARRLPVAAAAVAAAAVAGALAAPRLDAGGPWLDYRAIASSLAAQSPVTFGWDHRYGPLDWPREGREVLRVRSGVGAYWKAENLDRFDGVAWRREQDSAPEASTAELPPPGELRRDWVETIRVTMRGMESSDLLGAGTTLAIARAPHLATPGGSPGTWRSGARLAPGDSWFARVYVPRPTAARLAASGTDYPGLLQQYRTLGLPDGSSEVVFPAFGSGGTPSAVGALPFGTDAERLLADSPYAGAYRLARRLGTGAATPYAYVRRVERALAAPRFRYDESPPRGRFPLAAFLVDGRGYCQQFAGAMALLLRMGGVPARAVAGFAPGDYDRARREWTVSDLDAHSWVEAWFPGIGWTTFDPTPASAPALAGRRDARALAPGGRSRVQGGDPRSDPAARRPAGSTPADDGVAGWALTAGLLALGALVAGGLALRRGRGPERPDEDPALAELERALRRTGRAPPAATTLSALERRLATAPSAAAYVAAVRARRFAGGGPPPSAAQRRALRAELGRGLGPTGRLRAIWALPPWTPWPRAGPGLD